MKSPSSRSRNIRARRTEANARFITMKRRDCDNTRTPPQGACGWADLVRALDLGGPKLLQDMAAVLGLESVTRPEPSVPVLEAPERIESDQSADRWQTEPTVEPKPLIDLPFWRLEGVEYLQAPESGGRELEPVISLPEWTERPPAATPQPLASWPELLPRLRGALARTTESHDLDVPAIVRRLGRGDSLQRLPYRSYRRWGATLHIIEDRSDRLTPYWRDQAMVRERLLRLFPRHAVRHALIDEGLDQPLFVGPERGADRGYQPPPPGGLVLVLGDLGCLAQDDATVRAGWERFGRRLADAGCRAAALLPLPMAHCPATISRYWRLLSWERRPGVLDPERGTQQIESLLCLLAPTARVEPGLLRDLRRLAGLDAAIESLVWQHPAVISTSSVAATLNPEDLKRWRADFRTQPEPVRKQVLDCIRAWRARLPAEVYIGESALLDADSQTLLPAGDRELCRDFFAALSDQIRGSGGAPRGAEEWFLRFEQRSTKQEAIWTTRPLHRIWEVVHRDDKGPTSPPPEFKLESIEPNPDHPITTVAIHQHDGALIFASETETRLNFR